jgi:RNA polymerase sigma-70 factor (ECF subfamily)
MQQPLKTTTEALDDPEDDAALYDRYGGAIFAYVRLQITSREDAEDLTLEVFTLALEHDNLTSLEEGEKLAWLRRVAHNKIIDSYRRATRRPVVELEKVREMLFEDEAGSPEQMALQREVYTQLHRTIQRLPQQQQQLLRLRYGDGLRFAEIAALLNKREEALRKLLSRTLATLRTLYTQAAAERRSTC